MAEFNSCIALPPNEAFILKMRRFEQNLLEVERAGRKTRIMGLMNGVTLADVAPKRAPSPSFESPSSKRARYESPILSDNHDEGYQSDVDQPDRSVDHGHNMPEVRPPTPPPAVARPPPPPTVTPPPPPPVVTPPPPPPPPVKVEPVPIPVPAQPTVPTPPAPLPPTPLPSSSGRRPRGPNVDDDVPFICSWYGCEVPVSCRRDWTVHMHVAHHIAQKGWDGGIRCGHPDCTKNTVTLGGLASLQKHYRYTHQVAPGTYRCPDPDPACRKSSWSTRWSLGRHIEAVHTGPKPKKGRKAGSRASANKENKKPARGGRRRRASGRRVTTRPEAVASSSAVKLEDLPKDMGTGDDDDGDHEDPDWCE
ncbi:hypothetical protein C8Q78DRAFT_1083011 [Trametes maxima]|nr:hypothetical protein C8Q78DRAFT_1083011 [Trametes maxima]